MNFKRLGASSLAACALLLSGCLNTSSNTTIHSFDKATVADINQALQDKDILVIDARSPDAFNGWVFNEGEVVLDKTGGHIPGAQLFSSRWIELDQDGLDRGYEYAGFEQGSEVIIYGDNKQQTKVVADWLVNQKDWQPETVSLFKGGVTGWQAQAGNDLDYLPGYLTLVPPEYISKAIEKEPDTIVVQIGWDGGKARDYRRQHIPGAIYWDDLEFEMPPIWENRPVEDIRDSLARHGIDKNSSVIVYSPETIMSARAAVVMKYAGVNDVVIMNGTMDLWTNMGLPVEGGWNEPTSVIDFGISGAGNNQVVINIDEARELRQEPNSALVSIRTWREFTGQISGYDYFQQRGRIPGAIWGYAGTSAWNMDHYHNPDNTMRNYHQIAEFWGEWNIHPGMNLSFYCGNGARASEVWWYARAMGYENTSVYTSGWMRWRSDSNDIASGDISREQVLAHWRELSSTET